MKEESKYRRPDGFQSIEDKIRFVASKMKCVQYIFENWQTANVKLDSTALPAMLNVLPASGVMKFGQQQIKDYPNCLFAFMDKVDFDFEGEESDSVVERCKAYAQEFIMRINKSGLFEPVYGEIPYSIFYDKLDVNVAGITIEVQLKEVKGLVICPTKNIEEVIYGNDSNPCGCTENSR
jgi:hypothetical protein